MPALKYNCFNNILLTARSTGIETKKWEEAAHYEENWTVAKLFLAHLQS